MNVLQVITSLGVGGAERLIVDSVPLYQKRGVKMDVVSLTNKVNPFWERLLKTTSGEVIGLTNGSVYNPLLIFKLIPILRKYDVIHVHLFPALYWVVFAKVLSFSNTPIIFTEHNTNNRRRKYQLFKLIDRFVYSKLSFIGCISDGVEIALKKFLKKKLNTTVIHNGILLDRFKISDSKLDFFDKDSTVLIQVSSLTLQKDQETLIRSLLHLPNKFKLLLVGDGPLKEKLNELVIGLKLEDRVLLLGNRYDIPNLYNYADIAILSSHFEGFGLAIVEAMASGKPVIASDVPGLKEVVQNYGVLFEKGNCEMLASAIEELSNNKSLFSSISIKCLDRSRDFDICNMVDKYIVVYKKVYNN